MRRLDRTHRRKQSQEGRLAYLARQRVGGEMGSSRSSQNRPWDPLGTVQRQTHVGPAIPCEATGSRVTTTSETTSPQAQGVAACRRRWVGSPAEAVVAPPNRQCGDDYLRSRLGGGGNQGGDLALLRGARPVRDGPDADQVVPVAEQLGQRACGSSSRLRRGTSRRFGRPVQPSACARSSVVAGCVWRAATVAYR
jgi:hypothetical protein